MQLLANENIKKLKLRQKFIASLPKGRSSGGGNDQQREYLGGLVSTIL